MQKIKKKSNIFHACAQNAEFGARYELAERQRERMKNIKRELRAKYTHTLLLQHSIAALTHSVGNVLFFFIIIIFSPALAGSNLFLLCYRSPLRVNGSHSSLWNYTPALNVCSSCARERRARRRTAPHSKYSLGSLVHIYISRVYTAEGVLALWNNRRHSREYNI